VSASVENPTPRPSPLRESDALHARVRRFIASPPAEREGFDELALAIAVFQLEHVEPVRRLAEARGFDARRARGVAELPALPVDAFKLRRVAAHPPELDVRVFRTSGTTQGSERRGEHAFRTLDTYLAASIDWGLLHLARGLQPSRLLVLAPSSVELVDSSLSFMIDAMAAALAVSPRHLVSLERGLDLEAFEAEAAACADAGEPVLVLGTSFAYVYLLDALGGSARPLPPGSRAMITGGFKGRTREVPEAELRGGIARALGLEATHLVGEYGMTELSSQLWEPSIEGRAGRFRAPAWLKVDAVDPDTLQPVAAGELGLARFVDLANVDSAIAVQTVDRVRVVDGEVELFGRAPGAPPRGCSLAIEDLLRAARERS
jgi:hypothetical protein